MVLSGFLSRSNIAPLCGSSCPRPAFKSGIIRSSCPGILGNPPEMRIRRSVARPFWAWTLRSSSTLACRERIQLPISAEMSRLVCSSSSPAAARLAISFWKSWASSTVLKSGTWIASSTNRGAGRVPRLEWRYGARLFAAVMRCSGTRDVDAISDRTTRGSMSPRALIRSRISCVRLFREPGGRPLGFDVSSGSKGIILLLFI